MATADPISWSDVAVRIATNQISANSTTYGATETVVASVTASLVNGYTYRVIALINVQVDTTLDVSTMRLREDNLTGTQTFLANMYGTNNGSGFPVSLYTEYTAGATGSKTWVITGQRTTGAGTAHGIKASGSRYSWFWVDRLVS